VTMDGVVEIQSAVTMPDVFAASANELRHGEQGAAFVAAGVVVVGTGWFVAHKIRRFRAQRAAAEAERQRAEAEENERRREEVAQFGRREEWYPRKYSSELPAHDYLVDAGPG
jgi:flagellar biosynthesis/type III secretory pathway M-ring protein FliF/YscJ